MRSEDDLTSRARDYEGAQVEIGTVGWASRSDWFEKGTGENDGHTLVFVTLRPRTPSSVEGEGREILCHIADGCFRIPPKGARCYVIIPHGLEEAPGAGVIVACVSPSPTTQFEEDRVVIDYGPTVHVVIRGASVTMKDPAHRFVSVGSPRGGGAPGVQVHLPDGTGAVWQDGAYGCFVRDTSYCQMTPTSIELWQKSGAGAFLKMGEGVFHTYAPTNKVQGAGVFLGKLPLPAAGVAYGLPPGPIGPALPISASVFVSPT